MPKPISTPQPNNCAFWGLISNIPPGLLTSLPRSRASSPISRLRIRLAFRGCQARILSRSRTFRMSGSSAMFTKMILTRCTLGNTQTSISMHIRIGRSKDASTIFCLSSTPISGQPRCGWKSKIQESSASACLPAPPFTGNSLNALGRSRQRNLALARPRVGLHADRRGPFQARGSGQRKPCCPTTNKKLCRGSSPANKSCPTPSICRTRWSNR